MEFTVFVWLFAALFSMFFGLCCKIFEKSSFLRKFSGYKIGLFFLLLVLPFYLAASEDLWRSLGKIVYPLLGDALFKEVWYIVVFFRVYWPAVVAAVCGMAFDLSFHPQTGSYRSMMAFKHGKMVLMVLLLFAYWGLSYLDGAVFIRQWLLSAALYNAVWYWRFGYHTLLYIGKKYFWGYPFWAALLFLPTLAAGESFILPLVAVMGIGISDIWMDYHKRGAAEDMFSFRLK